MLLLVFRIGSSAFIDYADLVFGTTIVIKTSIE